MAPRSIPRRTLFGAALVLPLAACAGGSPTQVPSRGSRMVRWLYNSGTERMMAPDALTLMGITNEGRDIPVKLLGENGTDGRYVIALVSIRKVYEFVLHRFQNEVFVFHSCDRDLNRLISVRYARNSKPTVITDTAFAEADFQRQLAFWVERVPGR